MRVRFWPRSWPRSPALRGEALTGRNGTARPGPAVSGSSACIPTWPGPGSLTDTDTDTGTVSMLVVKSDKKKKKHYERVEALRTFSDANDLPDVSHHLGRLTRA